MVKYPQKSTKKKNLLELCKCKEQILHQKAGIICGMVVEQKRVQMFLLWKIVCQFLDNVKELKDSIGICKHRN